MSNLTEQLKEVDALVIDVITDDVSDAYVSKTFFLCLNLPIL